MLIGNRSAPLSVVLFAAAWGVVDKKRVERWMDSTGTAEREREASGAVSRVGGQSVRGAPWGYLPVRRNMKNQ